jgi:ribosome-associated protein
VPKGKKAVIEITEDIHIQEDELFFSTSRSSGPGGQHVNKVETRVTLHFDVDSSPSLSAYQKEKILSHLSTRINKEGILRVVSQKYRSQISNKNATVFKFIELIRDALEESPPRKKTAPPRHTREQRLEEKRRRGKLKRERTKQFPPGDDE